MKNPAKIVRRGGGGVWGDDQRGQGMSAAAYSIAGMIEQLGRM